MSTFKGVIDEFPDIRIDYFRPSKDPNARAPLACFLTHIHSDHIQGLDGFYGGPFIHCSAATKELLLRLERRTHRWNLAKGVLESRVCQYAEKKSKLKVIPMETPTVVELDSERSIRVTLFDANHCPGAVMFLIEGDSKAILYTGDIRAEQWWIDYLARHPILVPYSAGIKRLDKIYLDTTSINQRKSQIFSPKHEGIRELIEKVSKYPPDTIFHFNTWTFGYEDVWVALAAAFDTKIHLSKYHFRLFSFIRTPEIYPQGPYLRGYRFGNADVIGCLTTNPGVRFHSCERRSECPGLEGKNVVWITPVVTRIGEFDVHEAGSGGLESHDDLVLHEDHLQLLLDGLEGDIEPGVRELLKGARNTRKQALPLYLTYEEETDDLTRDRFLAKLSKSALEKESSELLHIDSTPETPIPTPTGEFLPNKITFPYSRHSSHSELRGLVAVFRPCDIYPCVVDKQSWNETKTMEHLFGDLCEGDMFAHDEEMKKMFREERRMQEEIEEEREMHEQHSQDMLERANGDFVDIQLLKRSLERHDGLEGGLKQYAYLKELISSTARNSPASSRPSASRPLKRPMEDEGNNSTLNDRNLATSTITHIHFSPRLPQLISPGLELQPSHLTLLEDACPAASSTSSNNPQTSPVRQNQVSIETRESRERATKRVKGSQDDGEIPDNGQETTPHTRRNGGDTNSEVISRRGSMDEEEVMEAMEAALGVDGRTWWDVKLSCTMEKWRYEEDIEL